MPASKPRIVQAIIIKIAFGFLRLPVMFGVLTVKDMFEFPFASCSRIASFAWRDFSHLAHDKSIKAASLLGGARFPGRLSLTDLANCEANKQPFPRECNRLKIQSQPSGLGKARLVQDQAREPSWSGPGPLYGSIPPSW